MIEIMSSGLMLSPRMSQDTSITWRAMCTWCVVRQKARPSSLSPWGQRKWNRWKMTSKLLQQGVEIPAKHSIMLKFDNYNNNLEGMFIFLFFIFLQRLTWQSPDSRHWVCDHWLDPPNQGCPEERLCSTPTRGTQPHPLCRNRVLEEQSNQLGMHLWPGRNNQILANMLFE